MRAAATLGGNLVLTRERGLESDAATLLMAAGAEVRALPASRLACPLLCLIGSIVNCRAACKSLHSFQMIAV